MHCGFNNPNHPYFLNGQQLQTIETQRDLGILVAKNLKFSTHVRSITSKAQKLLGLIKNTFVSREPSVIMPTFCALVRSVLEYGSVIWSPYTARDIQAVEKIQRRATKMVRGLGNFSYEERLRILNLDSLEKRRLKTDLIQLYKIINGHTLLKAQTLFNFNVPERARRHSIRIYPNRCRLDVRKYFFYE